MVKNIDIGEQESLRRCQSVVLGEANGDRVPFSTLIRHVPVWAAMLENGNAPDEGAINGYDWEDVLIQKAREKKRMEELGLTASDIITDTETNEENDEEDDPDEPDAAPEPDQTRRKRKRREDA